jgi:hypothetical protein
MAGTYVCFGGLLTRLRQIMYVHVAVCVRVTMILISLKNIRTSIRQISPEQARSYQVTDTVTVTVTAYIHTLYTHGDRGHGHGHGIHPHCTHIW